LNLFKSNSDGLVVEYARHHCTGCPETFREPPKPTKVTEVKPRPSPSPNANLFGEWISAFDAVQLASGEEAITRAHKRLSEIETKIVNTPAEGMQGPGDQA